MTCCLQVMNVVIGIVRPRCKICPQLLRSIHICYYILSFFPAVVSPDFSLAFVVIVPGPRYCIRSVLVHIIIATTYFGNFRLESREWLIY